VSISCGVGSVHEMAIMVITLSSKRVGVAFMAVVVIVG